MGVGIRGGASPLDGSVRNRDEKELEEAKEALLINVMLGGLISACTSTLETPLLLASP